MSAAWQNYASIINACIALMSFCCCGRYGASCGIIHKTCPPFWPSFLGNLLQAMSQCWGLHESFELDLQGIPITDNEIQDFARKANAHDFISQMSQGWGRCVQAVGIASQLERSPTTLPGLGN